MLGNMFREGIDPRILDNIINTLSNDTVITSITLTLEHNGVVVIKVKNVETIYQ